MKQASVDGLPGTAALPTADAALSLIVRGADEFVRCLLRGRHPVSPGEAPSGLFGPLSTAGQLNPELRAIASF